MIFLTTNMIDRCLSYHGINTDELQLIGITALFMAHKFENGIKVKLSYVQYM
jgi:hypothetical protein